MRSKLILIMLLTINLFGCATVNHGNVTKASLEAYRTITNDSVKRLVSLYPPAHTRFHIKQSVKDAFGLSLIESLRQKGYSLNESSMSGASIQGARDVVLYYVLDEPVKGALYRVTLVLGQKSLSRAYKIKNGVITPLGFWVRME